MSMNDDSSEVEKEIKFLTEKVQMLESQIRILDKDWAIKFNSQREKLERSVFFKKLYKGFIEQILSYEDKVHQI